MIVEQLHPKLAELRRQLENFEQRMSSVPSSPKLVQRPANLNNGPQVLAESINVLETQVEARREEAANRLKIATLAPQLQLITSSLQETFNKFEGDKQQDPSSVAASADLKQQEETLQKLEEKRAKILTLLESIPEGSEEGEALKESSKS